MKPDKILLGSLWTVVIVMLADFWFDMRFGFNIFLRDHWVFLANVQAGADSVNSLFYISLFVFAAILPAGLYYISKPTRRIKIVSRESSVASQPNHESQITNHAATTSPERPPSIVVPAHLQPITNNPTEHIHVQAPAAPVYNPAPIPSTPANLPSALRYAETRAVTENPEVEKIVSDSGYILKNPPMIDGVKLSVWAIGTDEVLIAGATGLTPQDLSGKIARVRQLIADTLDDSISVKIIAFTLNANVPGGLYDDVMVFNNLDELRNWFAGNPNAPLAIADTEDFEAYGDYINTVAEYFDNK